MAKHNGFSLTEVLMAVGILSIGMMLVATMFPVGIYLTTVAVERTMAVIVADGAFAKIQLCGVDPCTDPYACVDYENELVSRNKIDSNEFSYPSVDPCSTSSSQYYWSALYKFDPNSTGYLVTVFVARKTNPGLTYRCNPSSPGISDISKSPRVLDVNIQEIPGKVDKLGFLPGSGEEKYVNSGATILYNASGRLYRVIDRVGTEITLDRVWVEDANDPLRRYIWVIPPPTTGGRNADIEVYQRIMKF